MRTPRADMRKLFYCKPQKARDEAGNITEIYGERIDFLGALTPTQAGVRSEIYGSRVAVEMRLYGAPRGVTEGCVVWVYAGTTDAPDYEVASVERYPRESVVTIRRRGVVGG